MELQMHGSAGSVQVSDKAFARDFNETLVHQVVVAYMAGGRSGTRAQKNRAAVSGGGTKPWRQKGTGRARAGTIRSPLWRMGGKTFAAKPQDHSQKVNRKMYRGAMSAILSELVRQDRLTVVESLGVGEPRTKALLSRLSELDMGEDVLIVTDEDDRNLALAARNLPAVAVLSANEADPVSLVGFEKVLMTVGAVRRFEEQLG